MAFYPCSNSIPTQTYSITRNGSYDMGEVHKNRYISANVLPTGGISQIYRDIFNIQGRTATLTFTAANNGLYMAHFTVVSYANQQGWTNGANLTFSGSARYWQSPGYIGQSNAGGDMAYNASASAYVIGNGNSVTISWPINRGFYRFCVIELYRINW